MSHVNNADVETGDILQSVEQLLALIESNPLVGVFLAGIAGVSAPMLVYFMRLTIQNADSQSAKPAGDDAPTTGASVLDMTEFAKVIMSMGAAAELPALKTEMAIIRKQLELFEQKIQEQQALIAKLQSEHNNENQI